MSPIERFVEEYLAHLAWERGLSQNTVSAYRRDLARYVGFLAERDVTTIEEVTPVEVAGFAASLVSGDSGHAPLAKASAARATVAVRSLHRFALEEGRCETDPASGVTPVRLGTRLPKALSQADVRALLEAPDDSPEGLRDSCLLEVLYGTGARISEVCDLVVDDVESALADPEVGLRVIGKGNKERVVPLGSYARIACEAWLTRARPAFVRRGSGTAALLLNARGKPLSRQSAWGIVARRASLAGISAEVSPHSLRHSFATHLLDGGADVRVVQELLGHASVATTQIYTLVTADHLREVYLASHPRAL